MKKRIILLFLLGNLITNAYAQNEECNCKSDLTFLDSKIRKMPAYKINKKAYNAAYSKFLIEVVSINSIFECHSLLNELLISLNDNHCKVYSNDLGATEDVKANSERFNEFKKSELFNTYPKPNINLDSLRTVLNAKTLPDIEGVYKRENYITIGLYRDEAKNNYKAIILDSESDVWQVGEIIYTLIPFGNNYLLNIGGSINSKRLMAYTERIENGFFFYMGFQKDVTQTDYSSIMPSESTYYREELSDEVTYLKIGSFSSWNPTLSDAVKFYKTLEGNLNKSNLIIDLRNNGGGGNRNSDILFKQLINYAKKNKIYVLINHRTASNAEQFAQKLSTLENCQIFGSRTYGSLAYEIKNSNYTLPCGNFIAVLTSKKHTDFIEYESQGITPDVIFDIDTDWIVQLNNYISKHNES
jgi:hypothetical protein